MLSEQIATLETNYADAQAKITDQNASIEKLTVSVAELTKAKLLVEAERSDLQKRVADLEAHNDETMAAVESLAKSALDMLRVAQRPPGTPAAVIPFAPKPKLGLEAVQAADAETTAAQRQKNAIEAESLQAVAAAITAEPPGQAAVHEIMTSDSGDEHPHKPLPSTLPIPTNDTPATQPDDAMNRIHSTAALAMPANTMAPGPLPMFLQRDTVLQREGGNILA